MKHYDRNTTITHEDFERLERRAFLGASTFYVLLGLASLDLLRFLWSLL